MKKTVLEAINKFSLIQNAKDVTVAVSGGADSMSLLNILVSLKEDLGITVYAAHLNHGIRGAEADRDEEFVKKECEKLNVPLICQKADVPNFAKEQGISIELAARELRYKFLNKVAKGLVATAHTANDNLETVILNLARGTALSGLCGIPPKRDIFIRPLLLCTREQVENYCKDNNVPFVTDSSNLSDDYTRNKIRHNIIPVLKDINPAVWSVVSRMTDSLRVDEDFISSLAREYILKNSKDKKLKVADLKNIHKAIAFSVIRYFVETEVKEVSLTNLHISNIYEIAINGGRTSLPQNCSAVVKYGFLAIEDNDKKAETQSFLVETEIESNNFFTNGEKINNLLLNNSLDYDKIVGKSVIRTREAGDSIRLRGRNGTKTLKKLYNEKKIPENIRANLPVIADDKGVVWIYGIGVASRCSVTKNTKKIMIIKTNKVQNITD